MSRGLGDVYKRQEDVLVDEIRGRLRSTRWDEHKGAAGFVLEFARGTEETPTQVSLFVVRRILGGRSAYAKRVFDQRIPLVTPQSPHHDVPPFRRSRENPNVPKGVESMGTGVEGMAWECPSWLACPILTDEICRSWDSKDAKGAG